MTPRQIALVKGSFETLAPQRNRLSGIFFAQLLVREPGLRSVFRGDLKGHGLSLYEGLAAIVESLDRLYPIIPALEWLAVRAARRGISERHYVAIEDALLATLESGLGDRFTAELRGAWSAAGGRVALIMMTALEAEPLAA